MKPTIGRVIIYKPTEAEQNEMKFNLVTLQSCNKQVELPGIVVAVWGESTINAQVFLDGHPGLLWKTSITQGDGEGQWNWPVKV